MTCKSGDLLRSVPSDREHLKSLVRITTLAELEAVAEVAFWFSESEGGEARGWSRLHEVGSRTLVVGQSLGLWPIRFGTTGDLHHSGNGVNARRGSEGLRKNAAGAGESKLDAECSDQSMVNDESFTQRKKTIMQ